MGAKHLDGRRARALLTLVGEIEEIAGLGEKKKHAVRGLREMVGAALGCWVVDSDFGPGRRGVVTDFVADGYPDWLTRQCIEQYVARGSIADPAVGAMMNQSGPLVGGARRDLCSDRAWSRDPFVNDVRRTAGLDDSVYAMRYTSRTAVVEGMCLTRGVGEQPFSAADHAVVELFVSECGWLFRPSLSREAEVLRATLPRRHKDTLDALVTGMTEAAIARRLALSVHTVHQYVKELYRAFDVSSRAELLAVCRAPRPSR